MKDKKPKLIKSLKDNGKENVESLIPVVPESQFEFEVANNAYNKFKEWRDKRNQVFSYFDGRTLIEFIEDSVHQYVTTVYERDGIEDWQARINVPVTRNKINNVSGRAIQSLPIGQVVGKGLGKGRRVSILNNLYEHSEDTTEYPLIMAEAITEAMVKGTVVLFEGHSKDVSLERDIKSDGTVKETQKIKNKLYTEIIPLEDFYPSTPFVRDIESLTGAAWTEILTQQAFVNKYGKYEKAAYIPTKNNVTETQMPSFRDDIMETAGDGLVLVIHIYDRVADEFIILANGYWINPVKVTPNAEEESKIFISPNPYKHKKLPFFSFKFQPIGVKFLYGNSMSNVLKESQEMLNVLTNMVFDQSVMSIFTPIITSSADYIEDDFLRPGRRIAIDTGDKSIQESIRELNINPPSGWYQFILGYTKNKMEESSVDQLSSGSASGLPDRTTAKAVELAAAGVASSLSYFGLQIQEAIKTKCKLRVPNIIQLYFDKKNPLVHKIIGEKIEYVNEAFSGKMFNEITLDNAELSPSADGKVQRGRKIIQIYESKDDMPTVDELKLAGQLEKATTGVDVEIVAIPSDYLRDMFEFDTKVVADKRVEKTQATEQAVAMFKAQTYLSLGQGRVDQDEILADLMQKNGDDPSRFLLSAQDRKEQPTDGVPEMGGAPGGQANNFGNNITQQVAGAAQRV